MNSVELVKKICKERKIPISRLEKDCGFSNGYIRKLKEGKFPSDRLDIIAKYLNLSVEYLMTGKEKEIPDPYITDEYVELIDLYSKLNDVDKETIMRMLKSLSNK